MVENVKTQRLLFLDNIKFLFAVLVIFQHVRVTYGGEGVWFYIEGGELDLLSTIIFTLITSVGGLFQSSLMGLFFLMGAFFTPRSYDKKGSSTFWKDRMLRLAIPLLLYIVLINPLLSFFILALKDPQLTFIDYYLTKFQSVDSILRYLTNFGPMWFLWGLIIFTLLYTLWRQVAKSDNLKDYIPTDFSIPKNIYLLFFAIFLGFCTFLIRLITSIDEFPIGFPFAFFPQYLLMFCVGIIAARYQWFEKMTKEHIKFWTGVIAVVVVLFFVYFFLFLGIDADLSVFKGGPTLPAFIFSLVDNIICVGMIFVLIPVFYSKFNKQGSLMKKLSDASFPMYLVHPPIVVAVALFFSSVPLFPIIKLVIVFPLSVVLCYLTSHLILRVFSL
ncbi:MAG: acyltransferase family protein [Promethearchaeota archaeon]